MPNKIELTGEGIEKTLAVSYLTRYYIIRELIGLIVQSETKIIINVAGAGQNGKIYFDDINFKNRKFKALGVVKQFQQANDVMSLYIHNKFSNADLRIHCINPSLIQTTIHRTRPPFLKFMMKNVGKYMMSTPELVANYSQVLSRTIFNLKIKC